MKFAFPVYPPKEWGKNNRVFEQLILLVVEKGKIKCPLCGKVITQVEDVGWHPDEITLMFKCKQCKINFSITFSVDVWYEKMQVIN